MYHHYFGFREEPFGVSPDPRFFFASDQHLEATASLLYSISERRGFVGLIAPPGLGKTSVVVSLLDRLRLMADVVFLVHPELDGGAILESVLSAVGLDPHEDRSRHTRQLSDYLQSLDQRGRSCVVIIDEAQNLSTEALESVRMLSNFERPDRKLIQFVLAGQPALATLLARPECQQVRQRVGTIARLKPLHATEVPHYIRHRMEAAGAVRNPFTPVAVERITAASGGIPRLVNMLCFNALTIAFAQGLPEVREADVVEAINDLALEQIPSGQAIARNSDPQPAPSNLLAVPRFTISKRHPGGLAYALLVLLLLGSAVAGWWTVRSREYTPKSSPPATALSLDQGDPNE